MSGQTWRVLCEGGVVHAVAVHPPRPGHSVGVDGGPYCAEMSGGRARGRTPRHAIATLAGVHGWSVVAILAPGDEAPDLEASAARHAAAARIERYTLPAEVLALLADVPALLAWIAAEPERLALVDVRRGH